MRSGYRPRKKQNRLLLVIAFIIVLTAMLIYIGTHYVFSEISRTIGENGLLLVDPYSGEANQFIETIANTNEGTGKEQPSLWFEPLKAEAATVNSDDGFILSGIMYKQTQPVSNKWAILVHGYSSGKEAMQSFAQKYYEKGYNILLPDLRAHGKSEGDFAGMGWLDRMDMLDWINLLVQNDPDSEIVLHGLSMGAATVMMTSGELLPKNVKAIVEDSGYTSVWDILKYQLKQQYQLPAFPVMYGANLWSNDKWGYNWKAASAVDKVSCSITPILFIHGGEDDIVPTEMVYELYQSAGCGKRLMIIEGAGHAMSVVKDPTRYWKEVFEFIDKA